MKLFSIFSIISLILCCLGLYALLTYTLEQKVKEIGIRKVMGAGIRQIIYIINKEYIYLFITALMVSVPGSYYLGSLWLEEFANRIDLNHLIFLIPGLICLIVSGITLVLKTYFVANENPVNSLRDE